MQIAVRAGGFSALVVVGMAVIGIAILYATFYVWLGVDSPGSMKVTDCRCHLSLLLDVIINLSLLLCLLSFFFFPILLVLPCKMGFYCTVCFIFVVSKFS